MSDAIFLPICDNGSGSVKANYMFAFTTAFAGRNIHLSRASDSLASRGMNRISNDFLASDCDSMLIIDCDIIFTKAHIDLIMEPDMPLICGIYPKRDDNGDPCLCTLPGHVLDATATIIKVRRCGRGFMRIRRDLLERMKEENGGFAKRYTNHGRDEWHFWETGVVTGEMSMTGEPEFLSEDWFFAERCRQLGVDVLVDQRIALAHEGDKIFKFKNEQLSAAPVKSWRDIFGWFDYEDLYREISEWIPDGGKFVEVGVFLGKSICAFAEFTKDKNVDICAVDNFQPSDEKEKEVTAIFGGNLRKSFQKNVDACGMTDRIRIGTGKSTDIAKVFADHSLDAVFIDGAHDYESVKADIAAWIPKVKSGGILAGHDFDYPDVKKAVEERLSHIYRVGRCWKVVL